MYLQKNFLCTLGHNTIFVTKEVQPSHLVIKHDAPIFQRPGLIYIGQVKYEVYLRYIAVVTYFMYYVKSNTAI